MIFSGIRRKAAPTASCWKKMLTRKRATPGTSYEMSIWRSTSSRFCCSVERIR